MKKCTKCLEIKSFEEFHSNASSKDGYAQWCKICNNLQSKTYHSNNTDKIYAKNSLWRKKNPARVKEMKKNWAIRKKEQRRNYRLKKTYGIDSLTFNALLIEQNNMCKICKFKSELVVDHCHETGIIRGLLCHNCNLGLGKFKDNIENLKSAINYLTLERERK